MKRAAALILLLAGLWAGWWPVAAHLEARATERWLEARRAEGWQAEWSAIDVSGFPLAYRRVIRDPALADPETGWAWRADRVTLARPRHPELTQPGLEVILPPEQSLQSPRQRISIAAGTMAATLVVKGPEDRLARGEIRLAELQARSDADWAARLDEGRLEAVADTEAPEVVDLKLTAAGLALPAGGLRPALAGEEAVERLQAEARVRFDRPWSLAALEEARPQPRHLDITEAALRWGRLELRVAGALAIDAEGVPEGELLLKATNWRALLEAARVTGALSEGLAGALEGALTLASRLAGSPETLDIPLRFASGRMRLGPVPIGPAPTLRLP